MHDFKTNRQSAIPVAQVPQSKADKDVSELPVKAKTALLEKANAQAPPPQPGAAYYHFPFWFYIQFLTCNGRNRS